ncbi:hypothetical protein ASPFODRAFT_690825 [Aspergillus luchuensis CBS 106.47]|uniref:Uncharacterized protein n=1 Tax=Aspergillus luchuensis (strain CBS 106.47) TaxID=1137211 RepID=A0A1M3TD77_ASPLC|nr:hypothetical protein ASPFODRAFT_690825 [Aspergillus luchuensis CBS 106.47]
MLWVGGVKKCVVVVRRSLLCWRYNRVRADSRVRIGRWKFQGEGQLEGSRCHRVGSAVWVIIWLVGYLGHYFLVLR